MPATAAAALAMMRAEIWLTPATSTTEYIIVMSTAPTYGRVSPEATVETTSLGTPTGSCCIAYVTSAVPPVPPIPTTASSRPSSSRRITTAAAPRLMASIAAPRSPAVANAATSASAASATSSRVTSGGTVGSPTMPPSTRTTSAPWARIRSHRKAYSTPFVSSVPITTTFGIRPPSCPARRTRSLQEHHGVQADVLKLDAVHLAALTAERQSRRDLTGRADRRHRPERTRDPDVEDHLVENRNLVALLVVVVANDVDRSLLVADAGDVEGQIDARVDDRLRSAGEVLGLHLGRARELRMGEQRRLLGSVQVRTELAGGDHPAALLQISEQRLRLDRREEGALREHHGSIPDQVAGGDPVLAELSFGQHDHVERLVLLDQSLGRGPERVLHLPAAVLLRVESALDAVQHGDLGVGLRLVQPLGLGDEVLELDIELVRRPERVLDDTAHPGAVRHAHVDAERRSLVLHHAEQVVSLAGLQLRQQLRSHAALCILDDDDGLAPREAGGIPAPVRLPIARRVHLRDEDVRLRLEGVVVRREVVVVATDQDVPALRASVLLDVVGQLGEVSDDRLALEADVVPVQGRRLAIGLEVIAALEQPASVVEGVEVGVLQRFGELLGRQLLQIGPEQLHAVLAEAAAVAGREDRQIRLVEVHPGHTGVDLDPDDRLQVPPPDRVVAVHEVRVVIVARHLDPGRMAGVPMNVAGRALLEDVGDLLPVAVHQPVREVLLERLPDLRVAVLGELAQSEPAALADTADSVHRQDLRLVLVELDRELPALHFEDAAEDLDAALLAVLDELRVVDESIEAEPLVDLAPRLLFEVGQGDRPAAQGGPDQRRGVIGLEVVDHPQPTRRQARVVAVLSGKPCIEVDAAFHARSPPLAVGLARDGRR